MKPNLSFAWLCVFAILVAGSVLSLRAQTNDAATNTASAPTNPPAPALTNTVSVETSATNSSSSNAVAAEPAPAPTPAPVPEPVRAPASSSGKLDYSSFRLVNDRNIFNGNRSGQRITSTRSSSQPRSVRVESFALVGTLLSGQGPVAFFDGTDSDFRKALKPGGSIAGFQIKEILHSGVRLEEGTNTLDLRVGGSLRREDEGLWKSASGAAYASSSSGSSAFRSRSSDYNGRSNDRSDSSPGSSESTPPGDVDEVLKRLMEKREKE